MQDGAKEITKHGGSYLAFNTVSCKNSEQNVDTISESDKTYHQEITWLTGAFEGVEAPLDDALG